MSENWRDKFNQVSWENFYVLDAEDCGLKQARAEKRVKPAGEEFRGYILNLCERAEAEALFKVKDALDNGPQ